MKGRRMISVVHGLELGLVVVMALAATSAFADTLTLTQSGIWGALVSTTAETAPKASWSVSFEISSTPTVSDVVMGSSFDPAVSDFTYTLNGAVVPDIFGAITFFSSSQGGLIDIYFTDGSTLVDYGLQAYAGPESAPTILTGAYLLSPKSAFDYSTKGSIPITSDVYITATPEPSELLLLGSGLAIMGGLIKSRQRALAPNRPSKDMAARRL